MPVRMRSHCCPRQHSGVKAVTGKALISFCKSNMFVRDTFRVGLFLCHHTFACGHFGIVYAWPGPNVTLFRTSLTVVERVTLDTIFEWFMTSWQIRVALGEVLRAIDG